MIYNTKPKIINDQITELSEDNIKQLVNDHPLILFKNQNLTYFELEENSIKFGVPFIEDFLKHIYHKRFSEKQFKYIVPLSSSGILGDDPIDWHKDNIFMKENTGRLLYAVSIPNGNSGETLWADTIQIVNNLPEIMKNKLSDVEVLYDFNTNNKSHIREEVWKKVLVEHNNNLSLNLSAWMPHTPIKKIKNIKFDDFYNIVNYIEQHFLNNIDYIYTHKWSEKDLIFFNNLTTIHKRNKINAVNKERLLYRLSVIL